MVIILENLYNVCITLGGGQNECFFKFLRLY